LIEYDDAAQNRETMDEADHIPLVRRPTRFDEFYVAEYHAVVALTVGLAGNTCVAEDIAQEAFLRAYRDWQQVGDLDSPQAWVRRVAINLATSRWRRLRAEATALLRLGRIASTSEQLPLEDKVFWDEVRRLPKRQAQALALRYIGDLPVREIAGAMEIAEGTVRALLHQGRKRLERQLVLKGFVS